MLTLFLLEISRFLELMFLRQIDMISRFISEQSGHIIFLDENTTGDGLLSALHLLQVMVETGKPQALVNAKVANHKKEKYMEYPEIADAIQNLEEKFAGEGRVLIRPSGTEPLVRVMIEGKDQQVIQEEAQRLANLIQDIMF